MGITISGGITFSGGLNISDGPPAPPSGGTLLGYSFSDTTTSPQDGQAGGSAGVLVPDMITTFTLTQSEDVLIKFSTVLNRSLNFSGAGACRFILYIDGVKADTGNVNANFYSLTPAGTVEQTTAFWVFNLGAGSHTIAVYWNDALAVQTSTFYNRYITVDKLVTA